LSPVQTDLLFNLDAAVRG